MLKLGNIIHREPLHDHKPLPYINYGSELPGPRFLTLTVGWSLYKELYKIEDADILDKNPKPRVYWEFSPSEDIIQYTQGIEHFVKKLPEYFISFFNYKIVDPFFNKITTLEDIKNYFPDGGNLYVYKDNIAYYWIDNKIYGLNFEIYEYLGLSHTAITQLLVSKSKNYKLDDSSEYQTYYKLFPEFTHLKRSMVVFLFA